MPAQPMRDTILDAAEPMIRSRGYNGFSFRDIADAVGVKSASVHYHFPTKGALGQAVARRYTDRFLQALGPAEGAPGTVEGVQAKMQALARHSLVDEDLMCLCGILGAEVADLPPEVAQEARAFFERNTDWLMQALAGTGWGRTAPDAARRRVALTTLAAMEGALLVARAMGDSAAFEQVDMPKPPAA